MLKLLESLVKPKIWDLAALLVLGGTGALAFGNLALSLQNTSSGSISGAATFFFATANMMICALALMVLGKTAKMGTIWGNLLAIAALLAGMSGVLLASALWALS